MVAATTLLATLYSAVRGGAAAISVVLTTRISFMNEASAVWSHVRSRAVAPVLWAASVGCLGMSVMLFVDVVFLALASLAVKIFRRTPDRRYTYQPLGADPEAGLLAFPMVLVQIPMYNEKEVYKLSIGAACGLNWPPERMIVQVLDDSTDPIVKSMVELECKSWANKGVDIRYEVRDNRKGYKAGALKQGMEYSYVRQCDFVAIFDADFQPEPDFLMRAIPYLVHNSKIALVQAHWEFVNSSECLMTRIQRMTLAYHFKVEQEAGSFTFAFFGFNGTAGVWRISAINDAGGWKDWTTVEDMDLAVRASLKGWKFVYTGDIKVKSELPSSLKTYRHQQHRWTCGAANLFKKVAAEVAMAKEVSIWKKIHIAYSFFFVRKIVSHIVTFFLYCIVIPASVFVPEVQIPVWGVVYVPTTISFFIAIRNPRSIHLMPLWILFENVFAMHRMKAVIIGLLETKSAHEWIVTEKLGGAANPKLELPLLGKSAGVRWRDRINFCELSLAVFLLICATYDLVFGAYSYYIYIYLQSIAFAVVGFGYVGKFIPNS